MKKLILVFLLLSSIALSQDLYVLDSTGHYIPYTKSELMGPPGSASTTPGPKGDDGYTPRKGIDYNDGERGLKGDNGYTPIKGVDYFDGAASTVPGPAGYTPIKNVDYFDGAASTVPGPAGYTPIKGIDYFDGATGAASTVPGPKGDTGDQGSAGTQGIQGIQGIQGPAGTGFLTTTAATSATTGTMTVNMTTRFITITPTGACTFNASGGTTGNILHFVVTTSGVTSYTLTFGTNFKKVGTLATGTTTARSFVVTFVYDGTFWREMCRTAAQS